jgi:hypothetical protein
MLVPKFSKGACDRLSGSADKFPDFLMCQGDYKASSGFRVVRSDGPIEQSLGKPLLDGDG